MPAKVLTDTEVRLLRERAAAGLDDRTLASAFGITRGQVTKLRTGQRRTDAGGPITRIPRGLPTLRHLRVEVERLREENAELRAKLDSVTPTLDSP